MTYALTPLYLTHWGKQSANERPARLFGWTGMSNISYETAIADDYPNSQQIRTVVFPLECGTVFITSAKDLSQA